MLSTTYWLDILPWKNVYHKELNKGRFPLAHRFRGFILWLHSLINHAEDRGGRNLWPKEISYSLVYTK